MRSTQGFTQVQPPRRVTSLLPASLIDYECLQGEISGSTRSRARSATGSAGRTSAYGVEYERDPSGGLSRELI